MYGESPNVKQSWEWTRVANCEDQKAILKSYKIWGKKENITENHHVNERFVVKYQCTLRFLNRR